LRLDIAIIHFEFQFIMKNTNYMKAILLKMKMIFYINLILCLLNYGLANTQ